MNYKAIMTLGAAALCGSLLADVTSANCVGYSVFGKENNPKVIFGIQFSGVGSDEGLLFKDLGGEFVDGDNIQMSVFKSGKTKLKDFYYYEADVSYTECDGWFNEDGDYIGETERLPWGAAAWLVGYEDAPKSATVSGEVKKGHKIHTFTDPKTLTSSYYPSPFCPNADTVSWNGIQDGDNIQVQGLNNKGKTILKDFYYYEADVSYTECDGWFTEDGDLVLPEQSIVTTGEGFWFLPQDTDATFTEISPLGDEDAK